MEPSVFLRGGIKYVSHGIPETHPPPNDEEDVELDSVLQLCQDSGSQQP